MGREHILTSGGHWSSLRGEKKGLSEYEWLKRMYIYTMESQPVIKKNEIKTFTATWMDLEITILSGVSQTKKDKYHIKYCLSVES